MEYNNEKDVIVINPMEYIKELDVIDGETVRYYKEMRSTVVINFSALFNAIMSDKNISELKTAYLILKCPGIHYGTTNYFLSEHLEIPNNVSLDFSGASLYVPAEYKLNSDSVISFGPDLSMGISITSILKNVKIVVDKEFGRSASGKVVQPYKIIDLTNFSGVLEKVDFWLNDRTDIIALWQPFGTYGKSYSDRKIIRCCRVLEPGWRIKTPTTLLCLGDGCIIEHSILGYVAILGGRSYTIKGCLNDCYFLFDTSVKFSGSYWEIGQFYFLDSRVSFSNCRLDTANNLYNIVNKDVPRIYVGPWMSIDTQGCHDRLLKMIDDLKLDKNNFSTIEAGNTNYKARSTDYHSIVKFEETVRHNNNFWGYRQPMSAPLIVKGERGKIVGIEHLSCHNDIYIHNFVNANTSINLIPVTDVSTIPLVNGDFADVNTDTVLPDTLGFVSDIIDLEKNDNFETADEELKKKYEYKRKYLGLFKSTDKITNVKARILLDRKRKLYSVQYVSNKDVGSVNDKTFEFQRLSIFANMSKIKYNNLKLELSFTFCSDKGCKNYIFKKHFHKVFNHGLYSFGTNSIVPRTNDNVKIAEFYFARAENDLNHFFSYKSEMDDLEKQAYAISSNSEFNADLEDYDENALSDYCGNVYKLCNGFDEEVNTCYQVQWLYDRNVRAYMIALPTVGEWTDGDEVVLRNAIYRYFNGEWYEIMSGGKYHKYDRLIPAYPIS